MADAAGRVTAEGADALSALAVRAAEGDDDAFEALMIATQQRVISLALRLLGSREEARDAAQEVFLKVHRYLRSFRAGEDFHAWVYRIAVNVCRDAARRRRPAVGIEEHAHHLAAPDDVEAGAARAEAGRRLRGALAGLPERERFAVVLRDLEGRPTEEVARILGSSPTTIRSQICSARRRLRVIFAAFDERGPS